jgi:hypothetical protein|tara:strand:+ start:223 stop:639 length:417 start_codon:yes stop_codon:yes gene_type:complete
MYSKEDIFNQIKADHSAIKSPMPHGEGYINLGIKVQKFGDTIEIINLARSGTYYVPCTTYEETYFFKYGYKEGAVRLCIANTKRKLKTVEEKIRGEVSTRRNNKHIMSLKARREGLLNKYAERKLQLNKITNGKEKCI